MSVLEGRFQDLRLTFHFWHFLMIFAIFYVKFHEMYRLMFCQFWLRVFIAHMCRHMLFWRFWHVFDWLLVIFELRKTGPRHIFSSRTLKNSSEMLFWRFCQFSLSHFLTLFSDFSSFFILVIVFEHNFCARICYRVQKHINVIFHAFSSFLPVLTLNDPSKTCLDPVARP